MVRYILILILSLVSGVSGGALAASAKSPMAPENRVMAFCKNTLFLLTSRDSRRDIKERDPEFLSDFEYIEEKRYNSYLGRMSTHYEPDLQTRIFFTATGKPNAEGEIPVVDPEAKALYIYIHGSGTQKASGINFAYKANTLAQMGYAGLSFDLPYHMDGPRMGSLAMTDGFMTWLNKIVNKYRNPGQPVYLVGHSFGPGVVGEYLMRYPHDVDGGAMLSPAAYNKELNEWFYRHTSQWAGFWGDTLPNDQGSRWGGMASMGFTWAKPRSQKIVDPTIANPNLKLRIFSGAKEEYFPGKLREDGLPTDDPRDYRIEDDMRALFKNATVTVEPGIGHYIFTHKDANGHDVVLREMLALDGESLDNQKQLKAAFNARRYSEVDQLANSYETNPFFRRWIDLKKEGRETVKSIIREQDNKSAQKLSKEWKIVLQQRDQRLLENIRATKTNAPRFYSENAQYIDRIGQKGVDHDVIVQRYFDHLKAMHPDDRKDYRYRVRSDVYTIPEQTERVSSRERR